MSAGYPTTRAERLGRRRPDQPPKDLGTIPHGAKGYRRGCRCPECRAAERDRHRLARVLANRRTADQVRRPWRYQCLTVDGADNECPLPLGHNGDHLWPADPDRHIVGDVLARHGMSLA